MIQDRGRVVVLPILLLLGGCETLQQEGWYNKAHDATVNAADVAKVQTTKALDTATDRTQKALDRMQHYLKEKDLLKTFHDASDKSEAAIGKFLHKAGVGRKDSAPPTATTQGHASSPALPEHYSGDVQWPMEAGIVSSEYGLHGGTMHNGIDIAADIGEPVFAIADGDVIYASDGMQGGGNVVILRHDRQRVSLYSHNSALKVQLGDYVTKGSMIALVGNTGDSTGPHLHFEIRDGDNPIDPRTVLPPSTLADAIGPAMNAPLSSLLGTR